MELQFLIAHVARVDWNVHVLGNVSVDYGEVLISFIELVIFIASLTLSLPSYFLPMAADHGRARVHVEFVEQLELVEIVPAAGSVVADIERCLVAVERSMGSALVGIGNFETLAVADVAAVDIAR